MKPSFFVRPQARLSAAAGDVLWNKKFSTFSVSFSLFFLLLSGEGKGALGAAEEEEGESDSVIEGGREGKKEIERKEEKTMGRGKEEMTFNGFQVS